MVLAVEFVALVDLELPPLLLGVLAILIALALVLLLFEIDDDPFPLSSCFFGVLLVVGRNSWIHVLPFHRCSNGLCLQDVHVPMGTNFLPGILSLC